jgi:uridine kinase
VVELLPWEHDSRRIRIDYTTHLNLLSKAVTILKKEGVDRLIGIQGASGSGKSTFGLVLQAKGINTHLIEVGSLYDPATRKLPDISVYFKNSKDTYIIDDADMVDFKSFEPIIEDIMAGGGLIVMLYQNKNTAPPKIREKIKMWFMLDLAGLLYIHQ